MKQRYAANRILLAFYLVVCVVIACRETKKEQGRILVFSKTSGGYRHGSIEAGKKMFLQLGLEKNYRIDTTENAAVFTKANLAQYKAIVFLSTRGDILDSSQQEAFQHYIRSGGGFTGIHAATTTEYDWPWYNQLVGAYFDGHPEPQEAVYRILDREFPAMRHLPDSFRWHDEVYNFKSVRDSLQYILSVNENSFEGGKMGAFHPVSWYHSFEGGRSFYTGLGHFDDAYTDHRFIEMVWNGLLWTMQGDDAR